MPEVEKSQPPAETASGQAESSEPTTRAVAARWTPKLVAGGWAVVPTFFLANYHRLQPPLTNTEAMLVIQLIRFKWDDSPPRPAYKTLARCMGMTDTAVRNHARTLEAKGYLRRRKRMGSPNLFYLEPLFEKLEELMPTVAAEVEAQRKAQKDAERWSSEDDDEKPD